MSNWEKIDESTQKIGWRYLTNRTYRDPAGNEQSYVLHGRPDLHSVAVVALTAELDVVIARQFRPGPEKVYEELPGGGIEDGEQKAVAAKRELSEETGYDTDDDLIYLGEVCRSAYDCSTGYYYLATNCYRAGDSHPDAGEFVKTDLISIERLVENAKHARMSDAAGVLLALEKLTALQGDSYA